MFIIIFTALTAVFLLVVLPLFLLGAARLCGVPSIPFKRALSTVLMMLLGYAGIIILIILPVCVLGPGHPVVELSVALGGALVALWIIKRRFAIGIFRAVGVYLVVSVFSIAFAFFVRTFVVQAYKIPAASMSPACLIGDHILVNKFIYGIRMPVTGKILIPITDPERGDVVVFAYPHDRRKVFIKRVIGTPGRKIELIDGKILIDDKAYDDRYGFHEKTAGRRNQADILRKFGPVVVPENHYFVLGDNREQSFDSRHWGFVRREGIRGKAFVIYWSWDPELEVARQGRIGKALD